MLPAQTYKNLSQIFLGDQIENQLFGKTKVRAIFKKVNNNNSVLNKIYATIQNLLSSSIFYIYISTGKVKWCDKKTSKFLKFWAILKIPCQFSPIRSIVKLLYKIDPIAKLPMFISGP